MTVNQFLYFYLRGYPHLVPRSTTGKIQPLVVIVYLTEVLINFTISLAMLAGMYSSLSKKGLYQMHGRVEINCNYPIQIEEICWIKNIYEI